VFDGDALIATLIADEYQSSPGSLDRLVGFDGVALPTIPELRVETEAVIRGPALYTYFIHSFGLTPIPEPSTAVLLALGIAVLAQRQRRRH